jgi:hypothetical protein
MTRINKDNDFFSEATKLAARDKTFARRDEFARLQCGSSRIVQLQDLTFL